MAGAENPSFETPGVEPGQADLWDESYSDGSSDICDFQHHDFYTRPYDSFETSWSDNHLAQEAFGLTDVVGALFDNLSVQHEGFETSWWEPHATLTDPHNGAAYLYYYSGNFLTAMFDTLSEAYEDFEEAWGTSPFNQASIYSYAAGGFSAASFDSGAPEAFEDFEEEWKSNENAASQILTKLYAFFDVLPDTAAVEDFETQWTETLP